MIIQLSVIYLTEMLNRGVTFETKALKTFEKKFSMKKKILFNSKIPLFLDFLLILKILNKTLVKYLCILKALSFRMPSNKSKLNLNLKTISQPFLQKP